MPSPLLTEKHDPQDIAFKDVAARAPSIDARETFMNDFRRQHTAK